MTEYVLLGFGLVVFVVIGVALSPDGCGWPFDGDGDGDCAGGDGGD